MSFYFLGIFADRSAGLPEEIRAKWPDADVVEMNSPFVGMAVRLPERLYNLEMPEGMPEELSPDVQVISAGRPNVRFLLLRTTCWGGDCSNWGQIIRDGKVVASIDGDQALRRLIGHFDIDIGERELFWPLSREYDWGSATR